MKNFLAVVGLLVLISWGLGYFGSVTLSDVLLTLGQMIIDLSIQLR